MEDRIKRPKLARTAPVRGLAHLFTSAPAGGAPLAGAGLPGTEPWSDVVTRSVELGYRVIDDYVRQGERMARAMSERGPVGMATAADAQDAASRMAQYAMDFTGLWLQMLQTASVATNGWPGAPLPAWGAMPGAPAATAAARAPEAEPVPRAPSDAGSATRVTVSVSSQSPTEVTLDLRPGAGAKPLAVQSLRSPEGSKPRLTDVAISAGGADEPYVLRIRVPIGQPPGIYNGVVIEEETGIPVGTVSLRVKAE